MVQGSVVASSPLLYTLVALGLVFVVVIAVISALRAAKRCRELGISAATVKNVVKASATTAVVPSIAVLLGFVTLSVSLGAAWPWWRLSVIGSLSYEVMASQYTADGMGIALSSVLTSDANVFGAIIMVMTVGVMIEPLAVVFVARKYSTGLMRASGSGDWGQILSGVFFLGMFAVYLPIMLFSDIPTTLTLLTSLLVTVLCGIASRKLPWLSNFTMAIALILSMCSSVLWVGLVS